MKVRASSMKYKKNWQPLARLTKKRRECSNNKIRNERGEFITETSEIEKIIREYY